MACPFTWLSPLTEPQTSLTPLPSQTDNKETDSICLVSMYWFSERVPLIEWIAIYYCTQLQAQISHYDLIIRHRLGRHVLSSTRRKQSNIQCPPSPDGFLHREHRASSSTSLATTDASVSWWWIHLPLDVTNVHAPAHTPHIRCLNAT